MSAERHLVVSIGRLYCDIVFRGFDALPQLGEERFAREVSVVPGGGGFITAAHLTALGAPAALLARIGLDPLSQAIAPALAESGVDLRWLERAPEAGPQPTVVMVQGGERAFLSRRAGTARPATLNEALVDAAVRHLHVAEFATLAEIPELVSSARQAGLTVSLDPSWDDAWIRDPALVRKARGTDIFLPNAAEARAITGCENLDEAGRGLARDFPIVVIKDGEQGRAALSARGDPRPAGAAGWSGPRYDGRRRRLQRRLPRRLAREPLAGARPRGGHRQRQPLGPGRRRRRHPLVPQARSRDQRCPARES